MNICVKVTPVNPDNKSFKPFSFVYKDCSMEEAQGLVDEPDAAMFGENGPDPDTCNFELVEVE